MASQQLNPEIREKLEAVLAPFSDEKRANMLTWVEHEMQARPLIDLAIAISVDPGDPSQTPPILPREMPFQWILGAASPLNPSATIFAMLLDEKLRSVCIYTFRVVEANGSPAGMEYFREVIFEPKFTHGAISGDALYDDVRDLIVDDNRELVQLLLDKLDEGVPVAALVEAINETSAEPVGEG